MKKYTIDDLITKFGGQIELADLCKVTQGRISQMRKDQRLSLKAAKNLVDSSKLRLSQLPI